LKSGLFYPWQSGFPSSCVLVQQGLHGLGLLWGERELRSVANLTRDDGEAFFRLLHKGAAVLVP